MRTNFVNFTLFNDVSFLKRKLVCALLPAAILTGCSSSVDVSSTTRQEAVELTNTGKYLQAETMLSSLVKSMQLKKSTALASTMQQLAWVYMLDGKYKEAEDYAAKARYAHEQVKDNDVENKILDDYTQAMLLTLQGQYQSAEPLFHSAIDARLKKEAPQAESAIVDAPRLASLKLGLGNLELEAGKYLAAEKTLKEAITLAESDAAEKKPHANVVLAVALEKMALYLGANGQYADAEVVAKRSLQLAKAATGDRSPEYVAAANTLMAIYGEQHKFDQVQALVRAVWTRENLILREDHPEIIRSKLANMSTLSQTQTNVSGPDMLAVYNRVLDAYSQAYGSDNPHMIAPYQSAGEFALSIGDYENAESYLKSGLTIAREKLNADHPRTISLLDSLALTLGYKGLQTKSTATLTEAKKLAQEAISKEDSLPENNPLRARSLGVLASLDAASDDNEGAYKTFHEYFDQVKKVSREEPLERVRFMKNFQNVLAKLGKQSEFKKYESLPIPGFRAADALGSSRPLLGSTNK